MWFSKLTAFNPFLSLLFLMLKDEKWINIGLAITVPKKKVSELAELLTPYAKELDWAISSEDAQEGKSQINIAPISGRVSPKELQVDLEKIAGISFGILKDIVHLGDRDKALKEHMQGFSITSAILPDTKKEVFFLGHSVGFLWFNYELSKRLSLEKEDLEFSKSVFMNQTAEEEIGEFFTKKNPEDSDSLVKEHLEKLYGFKLH